MTDTKDIERHIGELKGIAEYFMAMYRETDDREQYSRYYDQMLTVSGAIDLLQELLPGDAIELLSKPGHWVREHDRVRHWHCSECGHVIGVADLMDNYCPNCGAKMQKWTHSRLMAELGAPTYENDRCRRPAQGVR